MQASFLDEAAWASPWRRRPVGDKVALSMALVLTALVAPAWPGSLLVGLVALAALLGPARVPARVLAAAAAAPLAFVLTGAASVAVTLGGGDDVAWRLGPLGVAHDAPARAGAVLGHSLAGLLAVLVLAATTPMVDLVGWCRRWRAPEPLLEVTQLTYRLLWLLLEAATSIHDAQRARLGDAAPLGRRLRATASLAGAVLVRSWDRARRMEQGLAGRGYEGTLATLPHQHPRRPAFRAGAVAVLATLWTLLLVWGRWHG